MSKKEKADRHGGQEGEATDKKKEGERKEHGEEDGKREKCGREERVED